jgi:hypothetical protein
MPVKMAASDQISAITAERETYRMIILSTRLFFSLANTFKMAASDQMPGAHPAR